MLYNFNSRRIGVCVASSLAAYRKQVPVTRPRQDYLATTRIGAVDTDFEMHVPDEFLYAQVKRQKV